MTTPRCIDPEKIIPISRSTTEVFKTGTWDSRRPEHGEKVSPCRVSCPAGNPIPRALREAAQGDFDGALRAFLEESPLPGLCGRVCYHPCEVQCNRGQWDGTVWIRALERAASEYGTAGPVPLTSAGRDYPVAVVGSGPAGLSAAYHLARMGHRVTLIEEEEELGGLLRWAIPRYRLPRKALERDLERILSLGIRDRKGTRIDGPGLQELRASHKAVFLASGAQRSLSLDIPGVGLQGVLLGVDFLKEVGRGLITELPGKAVIIGGGNVAIDAALNARRLGSGEVELVCLEQRDQMPAHARECEDALEEGIVFQNGWGPRRILEKKGRANRVEFAKCTSVFDREGRFNPTYDEASILEVEGDWVILSIGQGPDLSFLEGSEIVGSETRDPLSVDSRTLETSVQGVFAGGDVVTGPGSVAEAIGAGKRAALAIHLYCLGRPFEEAEEKVLLGNGPSFSIHALFHAPEDWDPKAVVRFDDLEPLFLDHRLPITLPRLDASARVKGFPEINRSVGEDAAIQEAARCFFCGTCTGCDRCFIYCPELSIVPPPEGHRIYKANSEYCKGCAVCAAVCPGGVMTMGERRVTS